MFTIGGFAVLSGVSAKTLRAWDGVGLFRPAWIDGASGYRYYTPAQLPELRRIVALRDLGLSLAEIRALAAGGDLARALRRRQAELERERAEIERRLAALGIAIGAGTTTASGAGLSDVVVREVPRQLVATLGTSLTDGDDEAAFEELEAYVRDLRRRAHRPPGTLLGAADAADTVYVPLTRPVPATDRIGCAHLPAQRMATTLYRGPYDGLRAALAGLGRWIDAAGLRATGPGRLVYLQFGAPRRLRLPAGYVVADAAAFVTEAQVPVTG